VDYKLFKDGKLEIKIDIAANENKNKKIDILFEITYDKDTKVSY